MAWRFFDLLESPFHPCGRNVTNDKSIMLPGTYQCSDMLTGPSGSDMISLLSAGQLSPSMRLSAPCPGLQIRGGWQRWLGGMPIPGPKGPFSILASPSRPSQNLFQSHNRDLTFNCHELGRRVLAAVLDPPAGMGVHSHQSAQSLLRSVDICAYWVKCGFHTGCILASRFESPPADHVDKLKVGFIRMLWPFGTLH